MAKNNKDLVTTIILRSNCRRKGYSTCLSRCTVVECTVRMAYRCKQDELPE